MVYEGSKNPIEIKRIFNKKSYSFSLNKVVKEFSITTQSVHRIVLCLETFQRVFRHIEKLLGRVIGEFEIHQNYKRALTKVA